MQKLTPGELNLQKFESWVGDHEAANDWADYLRGGKLNRTEVAAECGFGTPAFRQNPAISNALAALEVRLHEAGVVVPIRHSQLLDQTLIYTAVTRGIEQVVLVGDEKAALRAIQSPASASTRHVLLPQFLTLDVP